MHNPFLYMAEAHSSPVYCGNLVDAHPTSTGSLALPTKLLSHLNNMSSPAPSFIWLTPNNCDNGHDNNPTVTFYATLIICPFSNNLQDQHSHLDALVLTTLNRTTFQP